MTNARSLYRRLQALNTDKVIDDSFQETTTDFTEENKRQLFAGFNKLGREIGLTRPYQNAHYAIYKANKNPLPGLGNPDLKDTGAFYNEITTNVSGKFIKTKSADSKNDELTKKYSGIFGLGGLFKSDFVVRHLRPAFRKGIRKATGL